jgi:hypothetical protein
MSTQALQSLLVELLRSDPTNTSMSLTHAATHRLVW